MRLGIDFDGVISDNIDLKQRYVLEHFGEKISKNQTEKRILSKIIGIDNYEKMIDDIFGTELTLKSPIVPGARESLQQLSQKNEIFIVTRRTKEQSGFAKKWLQQNNIPFTEIIHKPSPGWNKEDACLQHNISVMLEDRYDQLKQFTKNKVKLFLLSRPFNLDLDVEEPITRVTDWKEFIQIASSLTDR